MKHLHRITNLKELEKIDETLSWTVDYQLKHRGRMEITLFKLAGWVAVPVISEKFFTPIVQEQLQQTLLALGYREIHAVALVPKVFVAYKVPVTFVDLMNLRLEIDSSCYALFTGESEPDWVIICIDSELEVIAVQLSLSVKF